MIPARLVCYSGGDPHVHPFIGGKFDIHHDGVFSAIKHPAAHFELQQQIVKCRPPQQWSAGLSVKCNDGLAVRVDRDTVVETSRADSSLRRSPSGTKFRDGTTVRTRSGVVIKARAQVKTDKTNGSPMRFVSHVISSKDFHLLLDTNPLLTKFLISIKNRTWFGHSPGICGGAGVRQYTTVPNAELAEDNQAEIANGGGVVGYPCRKCFAGIGYVGAICQCKEFLVSREGQLFKTKAARPVWHAEDWQPPSPATNAAMSKERQSCQTYLAGDRIGQLVMGHPAIKPLLIDAIDECTADSEARAGAGVPHFNKQALLEELCEEADYMLRPKRPAKLLCQILSACKDEGQLDTVSSSCAHAIST